MRTRTVTGWYNDRNYRRVKNLIELRIKDSRRMMYDMWLDRDDACCNSFELLSVYVPHALGKVL